MDLGKKWTDVEGNTRLLMRMGARELIEGRGINFDEIYRRAGSEANVFSAPIKSVLEIYESFTLEALRETFTLGKQSTLSESDMLEISSKLIQWRIERDSVSISSVAKELTRVQMITTGIGSDELNKFVRYQFQKEFELFFPLRGDIPATPPITNDKMIQIACILIKWQMNEGRIRPKKMKESFPNIAKMLKISEEKLHEFYRVMIQEMFEATFNE